MENAMNGKTAIVLLSGLLFACAQTLPGAYAAGPPSASPPAAAPLAPNPTATVPTERWVGIQEAKCERLLQLPKEDRAAASMFYMGYQAARWGARGLNVNAIGNVEALALEYCTAFPDRPAAKAFAQAYAVTNR
jgi:hypothetical protein